MLSVRVKPRGRVTTKKSEPPSPAAKWVREVRGALSQSAFAEKIGVHWVTVSNWERGEYAPDWDSAEKIRKAFPASPPAPGLVPPQIAERLDSRPRTLEAAEVAALIDGMRPELRAYVRDTVYRILSTHAATPIPMPPADGNGPRKK